VPFIIEYAGGVKISNLPELCQACDSVAFVDLDKIRLNSDADPSCDNMVHMVSGKRLRLEHESGSVWKTFHEALYKTHDLPGTIVYKAGNMMGRICRY
jgi:hypothetical protein